MMALPMPDTSTIEERAWPLLGYAPGSYFCKCSDCGQMFEGDKRATECLLCAVRRANAGLVKLLQLETEIQAVKDFGGGFFADSVSEQTRQFYRDAVIRRKGEMIADALRALQGSMGE